MQNLLYWLPRVTAIVYTIFISLFALDIFNQGYTLKESVIALFIHLIPTFILILFTWIAWKKPQIGGMLFIALGAGYSIMTWDNFPILTISIIAGPLLFTGILFVIQSRKKKDDTTVHIGGETDDITQMT